MKVKDIEYNTETRIRLHERYSVNRENWFNWIYRMMNVGTDSCRILEVGGGNGEIWVRNELPKDVSVVFSDISAELVEEAKFRIGDKRNFQFKVIDTSNIDYASGTFDKVLANIMLYHCPDIDVSLDEIERVLTNGGLLYATTAGMNHLSKLKEIVCGFDSSIVFPLNGTSKRFNRENGLDILKRHFTAVSLIDYEDALEIKPEDISELIAFVMSFRDNYSYNIAAIEKNVDAFQDYLKTFGTIIIPKQNCMFICGKGGKV